MDEADGRSPAGEPPEITWAPNGKGIMIPVEINDPHTGVTRPRRAVPR